MSARLLLLVSLSAIASALRVPAPAASQRPASTARRDMLAQSTAAAAALLCGGAALPALADEEEAAPAPPPPPPPPPARSGVTPEGVAYREVSKGRGGAPVLGDLIAIRFRATITATGQKFDDILTNPEPYYFRLGSEQVLPGVQSALKMMKSGDVWDLEIPGRLGFGEKGRQATAGKPRIPSNADLSYRVELVAVPGKDEELIEFSDDLK